MRGRYEDQSVRNTEADEVSRKPNVPYTAHAPPPHTPLHRTPQSHVVEQGNFMEHRLLTPRVLLFPIFMYLFCTSKQFFLYAVVVLLLRCCSHTTFFWSVGSMVGWCSSHRVITNNDARTRQETRHTLQPKSTNYVAFKFGYISTR